MMPVMIIVKFATWTSMMMMPSTCTRSGVRSTSVVKSAAKTSKANQVGIVTCDRYMCLHEFIKYRLKLADACDGSKYRLSRVW